MGAVLGVVVLLSIHPAACVNALINTEVKVPPRIEIKQIKLLAVLSNGPDPSVLVSEVLPLPADLGCRSKAPT